MEERPVPPIFLEIPYSLEHTLRRSLFVLAISYQRRNMACFSMARHSSATHGSVQAENDVAALGLCRP